jgi:exonuclease VII large subunit
VLSRDGEENLEIFDSPAIAETLLSQIITNFVTAIGHKENVPLLQKVADKSFITPTALGQYFNDIYNNNVAELQNSKAKLVDDIITKQLDTHYRKQVESLITTVYNLHKTNERDVKMLEQQLMVVSEEKAGYDKQIQELRVQITKAAKERVYIVVIIIVALIAGWLLGRLI